MRPHTHTHTRTHTHTHTDSDRGGSEREEEGLLSTRRQSSKKELEGRARRKSSSPAGSLRALLARALMKKPAGCILVLCVALFLVSHRSNSWHLGSLDYDSKEQLGSRCFVCPVALCSLERKNNQLQRQATTPVAQSYYGSSYVRAHSSLKGQSRRFEGALTAQLSSLAQRGVGTREERENTMRVAFAWATRIACWTGILEDANVVVGPNTHAQHRTNNPPVRCKPVKDSTSVCGRQLVRWTRWRDCAVFSLHWSLVTRHSHWHLPLSQVFLPLSFSCLRSSSRPIVPPTQLVLAGFCLGKT